jgi:hypothetical protein
LATERLPAVAGDDHWLSRLHSRPAAGQGREATVVELLVEVLAAGNQGLNAMQPRHYEERDERV